MKILLIISLFITQIANSQIINGSKPYKKPIQQQDYRYYGFVTSKTASDSIIRTLPKDAVADYKLTLTNVIPSGNQYFVYYYPATYPNITSILVNYTQSIFSFTISQVSFVNESGVTKTYWKVISNNAYYQVVYAITFS